MRQRHIAPDPSWNHLYPPFLKILSEILDGVQGTTEREWELVDGCRKVSRQLWLYGSGRPHVRPHGRSGPILTNNRSPFWHGWGLAADVSPVRSRTERERERKVPEEFWETFHRAVLYHRTQEELPLESGQLDHPGHVALCQPEWRRLAQDWVDRGFPPEGTGYDTGPEEPAQYGLAVDGLFVSGAHAMTDPETGSLICRLHPVVRACGCDVLSQGRTEAILVEPGTEDFVFRVPVLMRTLGGSELPFTPVASLSESARVSWDGGLLDLTTKWNPEDLSASPTSGTGAGTSESPEGVLAGSTAGRSR